MTLTADIRTTRYGTADGHQPLNKGIQATTTVYRGSVAVLNGPGGSNVGYLRNPATPGPSDLVVGMIDEAGPGTSDTGPGITGGATNGAVSANILTGSFILASGTSGDALTVATNMTTVYLIDEKTVGATSAPDGSGNPTRPVAGVQLACHTDDPSIPSGFVAVKLGTPASPLGGP